MRSSSQSGTLMAAEMAEQPERLAAVIGRADTIAAEVRATRPPTLAGTVMIARGSSDHAAVYGRYLIEPASSRPVSLASPSLLTLYKAQVSYRDWLAVAISQSGATPEITSTLRLVHAAQGRAIAITNDASSELAAEADAVIALEVGAERSVPATKTVTAEMAALVILARALGEAPFDAGELPKVPDWVERILADEVPACALAARLTEASRLVVVARGLMYGAALETALKLTETCGILAEGYSAADLRHGPIAAVAADVPVLALTVPGPAEADMLDLIGALRARGVSVHTVGTDTDADLPLPAEVPEALAPLCAVVRGQQLAHELALALDLDPDRPVGLTKVTVT